MFVVPLYLFSNQPLTIVFVPLFFAPTRNVDVDTVAGIFDVVSFSCSELFSPLTGEVLDKKYLEVFILEYFVTGTTSAILELLFVY